MNRRIFHEFRQKKTNKNIKSQYRVTSKNGHTKKLLNVHSYFIFQFFIFSPKKKNQNKQRRLYGRMMTEQEESDFNKIDFLFSCA